MRSGTFVLTAAFVTLMAGAAGAQTDTPLTPVQIAIGCAPRPSLDSPPNDALHIIGGQDTVPKSVFGNRDLLVVNDTKVLPARLLGRRARTGSALRRS